MQILKDYWLAIVAAAVLLYVWKHRGAPAITPAYLASLSPAQVALLNQYSFENPDMPGPMGVVDAYNFLSSNGYDLTDATAALQAAQAKYPT